MTPPVYTNRVLLVGHVGRDADLRWTAGGSPVANFTLCTVEHWVDRARRQQQRTEWHRIVVWGRPAEQHAHEWTAGRWVRVEGQMQTREWKDKDGRAQWTTEIVADRMELLDAPPAPPPPPPPAKARPKLEVVPISFTQLGPEDPQ
jgi:single-strand DNA-binding protein